MPPHDPSEYDDNNEFDRIGYSILCFSIFAILTGGGVLAACIHFLKVSNFIAFVLTLIIGIIAGIISAHIKPLKQLCAGLLGIGADDLF